MAKKTPLLFTFWLILVGLLGGCSAMTRGYVHILAHTEKPSSLTSTSSISLIIDPGQPAAVVGMYERVTNALQTAGFHLTEAESAEFIVHMQVAYSAKNIQSEKTMLPTRGIIAREERNVTQLWRYLVFFAYDQHDLREEKVEPVWAGQVVAESKNMGADDGAAVVLLFRSLGKEARSVDSLASLVDPHGK